MNYNFSNQSDAQLEALSSAVYNEQKRRFLLRSKEFPEIAGVNGVEAIKQYRDCYNLTVSQALWLKRHYDDVKHSFGKNKL